MDLQIDGLTFFYTEAGPSTATPILFIHGFPFSHSMWQPQIHLLKNDFRVIAYDQRGHGRSGVGNGQHTLEYLVDDFFALMNALSISKAIVCGLSMGGYVALRAIERDPSRFKGLILCDTRSEADTDEAKLRRTVAMRVVQKQGVPIFAEGFLSLLFTPESLQKKQEAVDIIRQIMLKNSPLGICATLLALATRTDTTASLSKIQVPTLILVGEEDPITPPSATSAMQQKIHNAQMFVIPNAAHMSNLENPAVFNQHLTTFLTKLK